MFLIFALGSLTVCPTVYRLGRRLPLLILLSLGALLQGFSELGSVMNIRAISMYWQALKSQSEGGYFYFANGSVIVFGSVSFVLYCFVLIVALVQAARLGKPRWRALKWLYFLCALLTLTSFGLTLGPFFASLGSLRSVLFFWNMIAISLIAVVPPVFISFALWARDRWESARILSVSR